MKHGSSPLLQVMPRLRVGIGRPTGKTSVERHVLSRFSSEEQKVLDSVLVQSVDLLVSQLGLQEPRSPSSPAGGRKAAQKRKANEDAASPSEDSAAATAAQSWRWKFLNSNKQKNVDFSLIYRETAFIFYSELKGEILSSIVWKQLQRRPQTVAKSSEYLDVTTSLTNKTTTYFLGINLFWSILFS